EIAEPQPVAAEEITPPAKPATTVRRLAARAEKPTPTVSGAPPPEPASELAVSESEDGSAARAESASVGPRVRVLRPTAAAINAGIRPGERAPAPPQAATTPRERSRERTTRARVEYAGTPGETLTPQTTYIPPPDTGRRRSRRGSTRGGKRTGEG